VNATTSGQLLPGPLVAVLRMHWPAELLFISDRTSYNLSIHRMPFHGAFATELKSRSAISSCCCPSPITEIRGLWWVDLVRLEISGRYFCLSHQILLVCCWSVFPSRPTQKRRHHFWCLNTIAPQFFIPSWKHGAIGDETTCVGLYNDGAQSHPPFHESPIYISLTSH
jgi:hypothetical protein